MKNDDTSLSVPPALQQLCNDVLIEKYAAPGETSVREIQTRVAKALPASWSDFPSRKPMASWPVVESTLQRAWIASAP
jgi:hypothetical protein